jgi:hypothetical protein
MCCATSFYVVSSGNEDVIHVDEESGGVFVQETLQEAAHSSAEGAGGVVHPKGHSCRFKQTIRSLESSFPPVFFFNAYVVESPPQICLSEDPFPLKLVDDTTYQR